MRNGLRNGLNVNEGSREARGGMQALMGFGGLCSPALSWPVAKVCTFQRWCRYGDKVVWTSDVELVQRAENVGL